MGWWYRWVIIGLRSRSSRSSSAAHQVCGQPCLPETQPQKTTSHSPPPPKPAKQQKPTKHFSCNNVPNVCIIKRNQDLIGSLEEKRPASHGAHLVYPEKEVTSLPFLFTHCQSRTHREGCRSVFERVQGRDRFKLKELLGWMSAFRNP